MTLAGLGINDVGGWLRTGGIIGMLALLVKLYLENRKLKIQEKHDDRDGYGTLIVALQADVKNVREQRQTDHLQHQKDIASVQDEHKECQRRLSEVEAQLRGVHRQLVMQSSNAAISLSQPSEEVVSAASRVRKIVGDGG